MPNCQRPLRPSELVPRREGKVLRLDPVVDGRRQRHDVGFQVGVAGAACHVDDREDRVRRPEELGLLVAELARLDVVDLGRQGALAGVGSGRLAL